MRIDTTRKKHLDRPVTLEVQCNIQSINNVDHTRQTFEASFIIVAMLRDVGQLDPATGAVVRDGPFICPKHGGGEIDAENWDPRLFLENLAELKTKWDSSCRRVSNEIEEYGQRVTTYSWKYKYKGIAVFTDQLQLQRFPFDWQRLSIRVTSARPYQVRNSDTGESRGVVRLAPPREVGAGAINVSALPLSNVFHVDGPHVLATPTTTSPLLSASCAVYPKIKFSVVLKRKPRYYLTTAIAPMFFITAVGLSSFAVPILNDGQFMVADKLAVSVTAMLGGVVFRLASVSDLPRLGYLTYLDWYMLLCEVTQYVTVAQNVVGYKGYVDNDGSDAGDKWSQVAVLAMFALAQLACLVGWLVIQSEDRNTSLEHFTQREKSARVHREKSLFEQVRHRGKAFATAGVTNTFTVTDYEGEHTWKGLGSPLTDAKDAKLFAEWPRYNDAAVVFPDAGDGHREQRYPDGNAPNANRVGSFMAVPTRDPGDNEDFNE